MSRKGVILIATLWIITILSFLSLGIGSRVSMELRLSKYNTDRMKALYLATAGVAKCREVLSKDKNDYDSLYYCGIMPPGEDGNALDMESIFKDMGFRDGILIIAYRNEDGAEVFGMSDEERKININKADRKTLLNIFRDDGIAEALMERRDKNGDFALMEEVLLVEGVTPEIYKSVEGYITVYGEGKVNINTVSKKALMALGVTEDAADAIIIYRNGPDGIPATEDDRVFTDVDIERRLRDIQPKDAASIGNLKNSFTVKSDCFKLESRGALPNSKAARTIMAILERDDKCGGKLLRYRE